MTERNAQAGLTLIEMIVVLAILATLATVAVVASEGVVEQTRYDATTRMLQSIEDAILGERGLRGPHGTAMINGFVADLGRLPVVPTPDPGPGLRLAELWTPGTTPAYAVRTPSGDEDVRVPGGWRGPYLHLGFVTTELNDGWGRPFSARDGENGSEVAGAGVPIAGVLTLGADNAAGGEGYDADLQTVFGRAVPPFVARYTGTIPVRVTPKQPVPGEYVVVRIYGPVDGVVQTIAQQHVAVVSEAPVRLPEPFAVSIGPRVLRAYQTDEVPPLQEPIPASRRSRVFALVVPQGGLPEVQVELE